MAHVEGPWRRFGRRAAAVAAAGATVATAGLAAYGGAEGGSQAWKILYGKQYPAQVSADTNIARVTKANAGLKSQITAITTADDIYTRERIPVPSAAKTKIKDLSEKIDTTTIPAAERQISANATVFSIGDAEATGAGVAETGLGLFVLRRMIRRRRRAPAPHP